MDKCTDLHKPSHKTLSHTASSLICLVRQEEDNKNNQNISAVKKVKS